MWPRSHFMKSHDLSNFIRSKIHLVCCIAHGYGIWFCLSDPDVGKTGASTVELIAHVMTRLAAEGVQWDRTHLHVQLDNTCAQNKNNTVQR